MKINSKHYTLVIFAITTVIVASFGYYILYMDIISQTENSYKILNSAGVETEKKEEEKELMKIYAETVEDRQKLLSFFVYEDNIVEFIERVEKIGPESATDLELSSISTEGEYLKVRAEIKGSWSNIMKGLVLLENLPYVLSLDNLLISASTDNKNRIWTLTVDVKALLFK